MKQETLEMFLECCLCYMCNMHVFLHYCPFTVGNC